MMSHAQLPPWENKSTPEKLEALRYMVEDLYRFSLHNARNHLLRLLDAHEPFDADEQQSMVTMRQMITDIPHIFSPMCEVGHITGSALVLNQHDGSIVLHQHKTLGLWLPFGGHADAETDPADIAKREAQEESGLVDLRFFADQITPRPFDFDIHPIPARKNHPEHLHLDFRYLMVTQHPETLHAADGESSDFRWIDFDEDIAEEARIRGEVKRMIFKARQNYAEKYMQK